MNVRRWMALVLILVLVAAACGGDDDDASTTDTGDSSSDNNDSADNDDGADTDDSGGADDSSSDNNDSADNDDSGGADDSSSDNNDSADNDDGGDADDSSSDNNDSGGAAVGGEENIAIVTVGDTTYEFDAEAHVVGTCDPDFFGAFWVIAATADGTGNLEMLLVPDDDPNFDETSKIKLGVEGIDERDWRADEDGGEGTPEGQSRVESFTIDGTTASGTASFVDTYVGDGATAEGEFTVTCPE